MADVDKVPDAIKRGTLMFGQEVLTYLAVDIENHNLFEPRLPEEKPMRLLDLLPRLARHGFDIIIPEIWALKAGGVMSRKRSMGQYFGRDRRPISRNLQSFFMSEGLPDNIRIQPMADSDTSDTAGAVRQLHAVFDLKLSEREGRARLIEVQKTEAYRYAYPSVQAFIEMLPRSGAPYFVISNDPKLHNIIIKLAASYPMHGLKLDDFLGTLAQRDVLVDAGLDLRGMRQIEGLIDEHAVVLARLEVPYNFIGEFAYPKEESRAALLAALNGINRKKEPEPVIIKHHRPERFRHRRRRATTNDRMDL